MSPGVRGRGAARVAGALAFCLVASVGGFFFGRAMLERPLPVGPPRDEGAPVVDPELDRARTFDRARMSDTPASPRGLAPLPSLTVEPPLAARPVPNPGPPQANPTAPSAAAPIPGSAGQPSEDPALRQRREAIKAAVQAIKPGIAECYDRLIADRPDAGGGRIVVEFDVVSLEGEGHIESGEVAESTFVNPLHDQCVLNAVAKARFPAPGDGRVTIRYPFLFDNH